LFMTLNLFSWYWRFVHDFAFFLILFKKLFINLEIWFMILKFCSCFSKYCSWFLKLFNRFQILFMTLKFYSLFLKNCSWISNFGSWILFKNLFKFRNLRDSVRYKVAFACWFFLGQAHVRGVGFFLFYFTK
jgi:hypothetical protein